jgi:hypothetical protein
VSYGEEVGKGENDERGLGDERGCEESLMKKFDVTRRHGMC